MDVINNSTIDTVIDFANVKFGMELTKDQVSEQLRNLSFSETLKLINSIKADDNDAFSEIMDLSAVSEEVVNEEELTEGKKAAIMWVYNTVKKGLGIGAAKAPDVIKKLDNAGAGKVTKWSVGAITIASVADIALDITSWVGDLLSGETIKEIAALAWKHKLPAAAVIAALYGGKKLIDYVADGGSEEETGNTTINNYYNEPVMAGEDTARLKKLAGIKEAPADAEYFDDLYKRHPNESEEELKEIGYGTAATAQSSRATVNKQNSNVANRRYNNTIQDQNRDAKGTSRAVAGSNKQATGQGAMRAGSEDPDDIERANNANQSGVNAQQADINAQEIERLKQLAMGG